MPLPVSETHIQIAACLWLDGYPSPLPPHLPTRTPALRRDAEYWHTPNGGKRSGFEAKLFKRMGVKAGIHDLFFLCSSGLWGMEIKKDDGRARGTQHAMHSRLLSCGLRASAICYSLDEIKAQLRDWGLIVHGC